MNSYAPDDALAVSGAANRIITAAINAIPNGSGTGRMGDRRCGNIRNIHVAAASLRPGADGDPGGHRTATVSITNTSSHGVRCSPAPTRGAGSSSRTWNTPPAVSA